MAANPKISVCIPVYNREKYIARCIESVLSQDYENIEIIISDNCSTDGTVKIINGYLKDKRIRFYRNETNIGIVGNFRKLLDYTVTPWIIGLSSDDFWIDPSFLSQAVDRINKHEDLSVFCGGKMVFNENNNIIQDFSDNADAVFEGSNFFLKGLERWPSLEFGAMVIKTSLLKKVYHLNTPGNDVFMFWQLCFLGKIYVLGKPFLMFRNHDGNACRWKSIDDFIQKILSNALVPIRMYEIAIKNNLFSKIILDKWLIRNLFLFITGSGWINPENFGIIKENYENMLVTEDIPIKDFGLKQLFDKLVEINVFEEKLSYYPDDIGVNDLALEGEPALSSLENYIGNTDFKLNKKTVDYLKDKLETVGGITLDHSIKHNLTIKHYLAKSGIDENKIRAFFNVFVYSKIHIGLPKRLLSIPFLNATDEISFEDVNIDIIGHDIFFNGRILIWQDKSMPEEVYVLLMNNEEPKFFIETKIKIKERLYTVNPLLRLVSPKNIGYSFVISSDSILTGEYDIVTLCVNKNDAIVFYNNKKLII